MPLEAKKYLYDIQQAAALAQLARLDETIASRISEHRRIIAFRNILIHGYAEVDHRIVWDIVEFKLPTLRREAATLLEEG
ncbi:MAG: HepT-like ribonuclease domain-containing protein [Vulcanimicrobiaceae bacterium]